MSLERLEQRSGEFLFVRIYRLQRLAADTWQGACESRFLALVEEACIHVRGTDNGNC
jgi:hypothetical protein